MAKLGSVPKKRILVVDDDEDTRSLLCQILENEGYEFLQAADGLEALERLKNETVDLIMTDRAMPRMDGMAFMVTLREQQSTIPILMISAYGEETFWSQAIGLGAIDYLLKPFKLEDVVRVVEKAFAGAKKK